MTELLDQLNLPEAVKGLIIDAKLTGSRVIVDPPPTDTDKDIIVLVKNVKLFVSYVVPNWELSSGALYDGRFISLRKGEVNLIVTQDLFFYHPFVLATKIAKRLNVALKDDRVALFHAVLFQEDPDTKQHCVPGALL